VATPPRFVRVGAFGAALGLAYLAGVATGVVGTTSSGSRGGDILDEAAGRISSQAAHHVSRAELNRAAIQGMLSALGDRWSTYYDRAQFASFTRVLSGRYTGVGLWVRRARNGRLEVTSVQPGSAAASQHIAAGDELIAVDGHAVAGASVANVVGALRGPAGTSVAVVVRHGRMPEHIVLDRTALVEGDVAVDEATPGILHIRVMAFTHGVGAEIARVLGGVRSTPLAGVVLDLRDNPGGLLTEAVSTASDFLDAGPVVTYVRRGQPQHVLDATPDGNVTVPLAVLVNGATASAAEVVAGALQDRNRAVVIGSRTFGKGTVQEPSRFGDGSALELTVGHYVTPDGRSLDGVGIEPDIEVAPSAPAHAAEERAIDVLRGLAADSGAAGRG
jgi:carboxyl-terminal processing protease